MLSTMPCRINILFTRLFFFFLFLTGYPIWWKENKLKKKKKREAQDIITNTQRPLIQT